MIASLFLEVTSGPLACLLCARPVAVRESSEIGVKITTIRPEDGPVVRRMRCPYCGGNLMLGETETKTVDTRPMERDEPARRGRPRKGAAR